MSLNKFFNQQEEAPKIDLSPMIDMIFLLLLFFMVTTTFEKNEAIEIQKSQAQASTPIKKEKFKVLLDSTGSYWVEESKFDLPQIVKQIESFQLQNSEGVILIVPDKRSEMDTFVQLVDTLKVLKIKNFALGTTKKPNQL